MEAKTVFENLTSVKILNRLKLRVSPGESVIKKIIFFSAITWLPLLIISLIQNTAWNDQIVLPFLKDYESYGRFLIALPAIFIAEKFINFQTSNSLVHFVESGIISENNVSEYESLLNKYRKLIDSKYLQVIIFAIAMMNIFLVKSFFGNLKDYSSWKFDVSSGSLTTAGFWYIFISLPIFKYLSFRLFCKFLIWTWFLFKISRMDLNLIAIDPDKSGGLGFLGTVQSTFGFLGFAQSGTAASEIVNSVLYNGIPIDDYKLFLFLIPFVVIIYLIPLLFFIRKLAALKLEGTMFYGTLSHKYSTLFENKWIKNPDLDKDALLLGSADIQSLADIGTSIEVIDNMRIIPVKLRVFLIMTFLVSAPFIPLIFLKFDVKDILQAIAGFLL